MTDQCPLCGKTMLLRASMATQLTTRGAERNETMVVLHDTSDHNVRGVVPMSMQEVAEKWGGTNV
jgi:hypothetical protein